MSVYEHTNTVLREGPKRYPARVVERDSDLVKLRILSDVHLEFGAFELEEDKEAILILAGDITTVRNPEPKFFQDCVDKFKKVIYIFGNHEYYGGDWNTAKILIQRTLPEEVCLLDNSHVVIDDVLFIGTTLWTDMNKGDLFTLMHCKRRMNDYRIISKDGRKLKPADTIKEHERAKAYIEGALKLGREEKKVVITHHMPSLSCVHQRYLADDAMNGAYRSDLDDLIEQYQPDLWVFGHSHHSHNSFMGNTRLYSNPRGYDALEENDDFEKDAWIMV